ncbi:hypothetical protein D3C76_1053460 [compost metagenome]
MFIDFRIKPRSEVTSGLVMELVPSGNNGKDQSVFLDEDFFGFFEPLIFKHYPPYANYGHWGESRISAEIWRKITEDVDSLLVELALASDGSVFKGRFWFYEWSEDEFLLRFNNFKDGLIKGGGELSRWLKKNIDNGDITIIGV